MKLPNASIVVLSAIVLYARVMHGAENRQSKMITASLRDVAGERTSSAESKVLHASVSYESQQLSEAGLQFVVYIRNDESHSIKIKNPLDNLLVTITKDGLPIKLPVATPPRALINTRNAAISRPYIATVALINEGDIKEVQDPLLAEVIIPSMGTLELTLGINKLRDANKDTESVSISSGKYGITLFLPVIKATDDKSDRLLKSEVIEIDSVNGNRIR